VVAEVLCDDVEVEVKEKRLFFTEGGRDALNEGVEGS
jgi:hypothetical protein